MFNRLSRPARVAATALSAAAALSAGHAIAKDLTISASLPKVHFWVGGHMDPFANQIEASTGIKFKRFYAGELVAVGRDSMP